MTRTLLALALLLATATAALAHGRNSDHHHDHEPAVVGPRSWSELAAAWAFEPFVVLPLAVSGAWYAVGLRRLWKDAGVGHGVRRWEAAAFAGGWVALVVALVSPLHPWGNVLFSAHMVQHEVLMLVAAPLLVLGKPVVAFLTALPRPWVWRWLALTRPRWVRAVWHFVTNPFAAWLIHAVVLWVWHIPPLFSAAVQSEWVHALQHLSFLASALLFWWAVVHDQHRAMGYGAGVLYMFTTAVHSGLLGALITLAATVWYPEYLTTTRAWGLAPLEDQQLGGLIMWVPACTIYIVAGLALFAGWLGESEARVRRREAAEALA